MEVSIGPIARWSRSFPARSAVRRSSRTPGCRSRRSSETTTLSATRGSPRMMRSPRRSTVTRKLALMRSGRFFVIAPGINCRRSLEGFL